MGDPSGMAAVRMAGKKNISMPIPCKSIAGSWE